MMPNCTSILLDTMVTAVDEGFSPDGVISVPEMGLEDAVYRAGLAGLWDRAVDTLQSIPRAFRRQTQPSSPLPLSSPSRSSRSGNDTSPVDSKISTDDKPKSPPKGGSPSSQIGGWVEARPPADAPSGDEKPALPSPVVTPISPLPEGEDDVEISPDPCSVEISDEDLQQSNVGPFPTSDSKDVPPAGSAGSPLKTGEWDPRQPNVIWTSPTSDGDGDGKGDLDISPASVPGSEGGQSNINDRDPRQSIVPQAPLVSASDDEGPGYPQVLPPPGDQMRPIRISERDPRLPNVSQAPPMSTGEDEGGSQVPSLPQAAGQVRPAGTIGRDPRRPNTTQTSTTKGEGSSQISSPPGAQARPAASEQDPWKLNVPASTSSGGGPRVSSPPGDQVRSIGTSKRDPRRPNFAQALPMSITEGEGDTEVSSAPGDQARPARVNEQDPRRPNVPQEPPASTSESAATPSASGTPERPVRTSRRDPRLQNVPQALPASVSAGEDERVPIPARSDTSGKTPSVSRWRSTKRS